MPQLPTPLFEDIRNLLIPHMRLKEDRVALLTPVLSALPIYDQIQWDWNATACATHLISRASMDELGAVLRQARIQTGDDGEQRIDDVMKRLADYAAGSTSALSTPTPTSTLPPPSASPRTSDHIFISYAHADRAWVERLANDLRERGYIVWIDFSGLRGGDVWQQSISDGIHASAVVLLILSPDSVRSEWVGIEVGAALAAGKKLIPLRVRPFNEADEAAYQRMHIAHIQHRVFTEAYDTAFRELLHDLPPPAAGIAGHCAKIAARLASLPWGLDHYIQEEAKLLPIHASPYDEGGSRGQRENLMLRLKRGSRLIVLGEPGIGKTVALERLAWELATADLLVVPVLIKLLEYDGQPILEWIRLKLIETGEIALKREQTADYLNRMAYDGCILLDGLNEVRPAYREALNGEITRFALEYPRHRIIVTSRAQDESWRQLRQGTAFQETLVVQAILPDDAQRYLSAHLGDDDSAALWNGLDERIRELALTPLLLWLIKEAYLEAKAAAKGGAVRIPDNRGALYRSFVGRLMRRDDERGLSRKIPDRERLAALETLALAMHENKTLIMARDEVESRVGGSEMLDALLANGLLTGDAQIRFAPHQTIQEHFAARALEDQVMRAAKAGGLAKLARRAGFTRDAFEYARDPWWWETFIQLAGLTTEGNTLALALADSNPWLAWWCFQEGGKFDKTVRAKIGNRSEALVHSSNVNDRRAAANALAKLQTPRVKEYLARLSIDTVPDIARTALGALIGMGEDGITEFIKQFPDYIEKLIPKDRAAWGRAIHDIDPRPGVGLRADGLPDIDWVTISGGAFIYQDQKITLPAFQMSRYLITYRQFQAFIEAADGFYNPEWWKGLAAEDDHKAQPGDQAFKFWNHPRERVSWYDAVAFCRWLSAKLGREIRLPTEFEWERAARGTDGREYSYPGRYDPAKGNTSDTGIGQTSAVGIFPDGASPDGVLDMSGNVWEWCLTDYDKPEIEAAKENIGSDIRRVLRGGSWYDNRGGARAAYRFSYDPNYRDSSIGVRVVLSSPI